MEETVIIFKPQLVARGKEKEAFNMLLGRLDDALVFHLKRMTLSFEQCREHYNKDQKWREEKGEKIIREKKEKNLPITKTAEEYGQEILNDLYKHMRSGPVVVILLKGPDGLIDKARKIVGHTDPKKAEPGTLRALFGLDICCNGIHCSENAAEAAREKSIFF